MRQSKSSPRRYFIDGLSYMALGLFSSLIIGLIIGQLAKIEFLSFLQFIADMLDASSPVVGAAIGVAVAHGLKSRPLAVFSCAAVGALGYSLGGPVGCYVAAVVGSEHWAIWWAAKRRWISCSSRSSRSSPAG